MKPRDPELSRLLAGELRRHEHVLLDPAVGPGAIARALHTLKGSAGLAGERALADAFSRLERRSKDGDASATSEALVLMRSAAEALDAGLPALADGWPEPPADLRASPPDPALRGRYLEEMRDRLAGIDHAMVETGDESEALAAVFRHVHAMKGAAAAVGDEATTWFTHGLESQLRLGGGSGAEARGALLEVSRWRSVLGDLVVEPARALEAMRKGARSGRSGLPGADAPPAAADEPGARGDEEATLRVPARSLGILVDALARLSALSGDLAQRADGARNAAREMRGQRLALFEALRLIGPPRPWGAPAAAIARIRAAAMGVGSMADQIEATGARARALGETLDGEVSSAFEELSSMQRTSVRELFERIAQSVEALAHREGREVRVGIGGADATIDRRVAEQLVNPLLQLARNALAHGIEPAEARVLAGKHRAGTILLSAESRGDRLRLLVEDDGAGVDGAVVRERAVQSGTISSEMARAVDDDTLLALLFVPGFSTREGPDLLAGRGVGLDLTLGIVRRLGGAIRLASRLGRGLSVTVDLPRDTGRVKMLWVQAGGHEFAIALGRTRRVRAAADVEPPPVHLSRLLDLEAARSPHFAIEISLGAGQPEFVLGVDGVGEVEEVTVRPISPLVMTAGPYAGAIVRGDGALALALDAQALEVEILELAG